MDSNRYEAGLQVRREVLGDAHVDTSLANTDAFTEDFQRLVTEYCWGEAWTGTALSRTQRSLNNLCLLAALNRGEEFDLHLRGALRNGCTTDEIRETLVQIAVYAGIPAGVEAFRRARRVLDDETDG